MELPNLTNQRVFVTGISGFIGENLAFKLLAKGAIVHGLFNSTFPSRIPQKSTLILFQGDITDAEVIEKAMRGCEYVFHLAAFANVWSKYPEMPRRINTEGTLTVIEACKKVGVKKLIAVSTAGTFGPMQDGQNISETSIRQMPFFTEYEATKHKANELLLKACETDNLNACILSPTRVFGPGQLSQSNSMTVLTKKYTEGSFRFLPADGNGLGNYVFVDDVVTALLLALERGQQGENYLIGSYNLSYREFFDTVGKASGAIKTMFGLPISMLMLFGALNELYTQVFKKAPIITRPWIKRYLFDWGVDNSKAKKELGFRPISFEEAIEKTLAWLKAEKHVK